MEHTLTNNKANVIGDFTLSEFLFECKFSSVWISKVLRHVRSEKWMLSSERSIEQTNQTWL